MQAHKLNSGSLLGIAFAAYLFLNAGCKARAQQVSQDAPQALALTGDIGGTHDPSIAEDRGTYYVFATGAAYPPRPEGAPMPPPGTPQPKPSGQFPIRCSKDLLAWKRCGQIFPEILAWIREMSPNTPELWAPDVSYFDGQYHLYYAFSVFGKNTSGIALATNVTLDPADPRYKWEDHGLVLRSFATDDFNAIDPNLVLDAQGEAWLSFGSFWRGIKMRHLDRKTGLLSTTDTKTYSLASRMAGPTPGPRNTDLPPDAEAVEAPFIFAHGGYYYLFVSWDLCCRGLKSTYRTMVGRAASVTGPYLDKDGKPMETGGGSPLLTANSTWLGPGGESLLHLTSGSMKGSDLIVYHAYSSKDGRPAMQLSTVTWKNGWPQAALGTTLAR